MAEAGAAEAPSAPSTVIMVPNPKGLAARLLQYVEDEDAYGLPEDADRDGAERGEASSSAMSAPLAGRTASYLLGERSDVDGGMTSSFYTETTSRMQPIDLSAFFGRSAIDVGDPSRYNPDAAAQDAGGDAGHPPLESANSGSLLGLPLPGTVMTLPGAQEPVNALPPTDLTAQDVSPRAGDAQADARRGASRRPPSASAKRDFDILSLNGRWEDAFAEKQARAGNEAGSGGGQPPSQRDAAPVVTPAAGATEVPTALQPPVTTAVNSKDAAAPRSPAEASRGMPSMAEGDGTGIDPETAKSMATDMSAAVTMHSARTESTTLQLHASPTTLSPSDITSASPVSVPALSVRAVGVDAAASPLSKPSDRAPPAAAKTVSAQPGGHVRTPDAIVPEVPATSVGCFCGGGGSRAGKR